MVDVLKKKIMTHLGHKEYKPVKLSDVAKSLGIGKDEFEDFKKTFAQLRAEGLVILGSKNLASLPPVSGEVYGTFRASAKGFGFVTPTEQNSHGDLFIPADYTAEAMTGDTVVAKVEKEERRGTEARYSGKIVEILQRANNRFVGTVIKKGDLYYLVPDGKFTEVIEIEDVTAKNAQPGDKAVVEIISYPTSQKYGRGVIVEVLGKSGGYKTEIDAVIRRFALPYEFNSDCLTEAGRAAGNFEKAEFSDRLDLTKKTIITIDPEDSKDFDDAISVEKNPDNTFTLGVHIADVSAFVKPASALDIEAKDRGNSVYLPGLVLPMLPETLSNGVCSLQPQQRRLAKSAFITYDNSGKVLKAEFAESIICSAARLTYTEADKILKGQKTNKPVQVVSLLHDMEKFAKIIEARRNGEGMLHLDLPEIELVFDKAGRVVDAHPADNCYPHTMIEMFMVEANEAVARLFDSLDIPFIRRIHPDPDSLNLKSLAQTLKVLGVSSPKNPDRFALQKIIDYVKGKPAAFAVNTYILRSLARAEYSPLDIGHYALASRHYTHFTSPIRRYADLLVHRLLELYLKGRLQKNSSDILPIEDLTEIGRHISFTDRRAEDAEADLRTVFVLQLMKSRLGQTMETVVSGLANFGVFVQCTKFGVEGLIPIDLLGTDKFVYNHSAKCVHGMRNGRTFHIGMPLTVKIVSVNIAARQLNVVPVEKSKEKTDRKKKLKNKRKRKR
ncbi:MAG: ribonuclease R [Planctomycetes bacterium]|nr:ribonuclease R [Planctomycetota bacterium]MBU1518061.1 ribonuclease R [Planctomycetota bacterium]MBU2458500.1 ribonuclease R [Planctomycetota bacterium]MBU2596217.1 ribonuclease R [Planctomycetota bacterium]